MGYNTAVDFASTQNLTKAISMHFAGNCYPPIPQYMVPVAEKAIAIVVEAEVCRDAEMLDTMIELPEEVEFRGSNQVSAGDAVEKLFLGAFVDMLLMDETE